jgi:DNA-binding MarR family transcriptional regulator
MMRRMESRQDTLGFLVGSLSRLLRRAYRQRLEGSSLTLAQARVLIYVSRNEGIRQVDLAEMLEVQPITVARLIDHLAAAGLLERRSDPGDRRAYQVVLTPAAGPALAAIAKVAAEIEAEVLRDLDEQQVAIFFSSLRQIRDKLGSR